MSKPAKHVLGSHAEPESIEAKLRGDEARISELVSELIDWHEVSDTLSKIDKAREGFHEYLDALGIENILTEHVPPNQRWMLERWLSAIRATDEGLDELDGMVP